jgi:hypothetical protein
MKLAVAMSAIFARVTALLAIVTVIALAPLPVASPERVIVWSPVFDPLTEVVPVTASVGVDEPEIATVLYLPPVMSPVVSAIVTALFWTSLPVVPSNRTTALSTDEAGPTTSPDPLADAAIVIVSVAAFVVIVMFDPATSVRVSLAVSATTSDWPLTEIVENRFWSPVLVPEEVPLNVPD